MSKNIIPADRFCSFMIKNKRFNAFIEKANRKGFTVKYFANNPNPGNFFNATNICVVPVNKILPYQK